MDVFDLVAKISLDKSAYDKGLDQAASKGKSIGSTIGGAMSKIGGAAKTAGKVMGAGVLAASAGVVALTKSAVEGYSEHEQLTGGISKLYGTAGQTVEEYAKSVGKSVDDVKGDYNALDQAQQLVFKNANNAYKTSGMTANQYMETATQFSASLISSLGGDTVKAAEQTDVAMRAISDNVNTFGSNMDDVTNAFKGFSKQNYTMLDNLKLGYGGTKEEMERLIEDANKWGAANGKASNLSMDSFSDVVTAIEQIQEAQNIAGTTSKEATKTIEGSINMTKAAWSNLISSLGDKDADIPQLVNNVIESAGNVINNVLPVVEQALKGIATAVGKMAPAIVKKLPEMLAKAVPEILDAAISAIQTFADAIGDNVDVIAASGVSIVKSLVTTIREFAPKLWSSAVTVVKEFANGLQSSINGDQILSKGVEMISSFVNGILEALPQVIASAGAAIVSFVNKILSSLPKVLDAGTKLTNNLSDGISKNLPKIITAIGKVMIQLVKTIIKNAPQILAAGVKLILALAKGLIKALPQVIAAIGSLILQILAAIVKALPKIIKAGADLIYNLAKGFVQSLPEIIASIGRVIAQVLSSLVRSIPQLLATGASLIASLAKGLIQGIPKVIAAVPKVFKAIVDAFKKTDWKSIGENIVKGIGSGIKSMEKWLKEKVNKMADGIAKGAKDKLGIHSPSTVFAEIGRYMALGLGKGWDETGAIVKRNIINSLDYGNVAGSLRMVEADAENHATIPGLYALLQNYLPSLANLQVVLDSGELVGATAPAMNRAIGDIGVRRRAF